MKYFVAAMAQPSRPNTLGCESSSNMDALLCAVLEMSFAGILEFRAIVSALTPHSIHILLVTIVNYNYCLKVKTTRIE